MANKEPDDNENPCHEIKEAVPEELSSLVARTANHSELPFLDTISSYTDNFYPDFKNKTHRVPAVYFQSEKLEQHPDYQQCSQLDQATIHGEEAEMRFCDALESMKHVNSFRTEEPMMVISSFYFENYLCKLKSELEAGRIAAPPEQHEESDEKGQHDVLLLHLRHGVTFFQVKGIEEFNPDSTIKGKKLKHARDKHGQKIQEYVKKAIQQLDKDEKFFNHIMKDIKLNLNISKVIVLPNITRETLHKLTATRSVLEAKKMLNSCICSDEIPLTSDVNETRQQKQNRLRDWWKKNIEIQKGFKNDEDYKQVIGRYCGLLSMVEIPTTKEEQSLRGGKVEARNLGDAVAEQGYRSMRIILTPKQAKILNCQEKRLVIDGDYGTGKTILLILKARQILREKKRVCLASGIATCMSYFLYECVIAGLNDLKSKVTMFQGESLQTVLDHVKLTSAHLFFDETWTPLPARLDTSVFDVGKATSSILSTIWFVKNREYVNDSTHLCFSGFNPVTFCKPLRCPTAIQNILANGDISKFTVIDHSHHSDANTQYYECEECVREIQKTFASLGLKVPDRKELADTPHTASSCSPVTACVTTHTPSSCSPVTACVTTHTPSSCSPVTACVTTHTPSSSSPVTACVTTHTPSSRSPVTDTSKPPTDTSKPSSDTSKPPNITSKPLTVTSTPPTVTSTPPTVTSTQSTVTSKQSPDASKQDQHVDSSFKTSPITSKPKSGQTQPVSTPPLRTVSDLDKAVGAIPGQGLTWSDVMFVTSQRPCVFKRMLGLPCECPIPGDSARRDNQETTANFDKFDKDVFLCRKDAAIATCSAHPIMGIERKVVFCVVNDISRPCLSSDNLKTLRPFISRSTSHLIFLNCPKSPKDNNSSKQ